MASHTIASLPRISREQLAEALRSKSDKVAVIDVRDSDYVSINAGGPSEHEPDLAFFYQIGGHIAGGQNVTVTALDYRLPELVRTLKDKDTVVFHCALSQQRGPGSALRYLRERERLEGKGEVEAREDGEKVGEKQKVAVLEGGFVKWQEK